MQTLAIALENPVTWAVIIGWIMSVILHEFSHGFVAHLGGDYTIRERGGLSLNPLQYIDPLNSLILPAVFLAMGGIPLPGGVTYIRRDLIRSRAWNSLVSFAGPLTNFLLFVLLAMPFHPAIGLIDTREPLDQYATWQIFIAALARLQMIAFVLNMLPIPPLDGFQIIAPYMDQETREKLTTPPASTIAFLLFFFVIWKVPQAFELIYTFTHKVERLLGFDYASAEMMRRCYNFALFGHSD
ncbi:MAG TPA: site-2 protease family protein [Tepidisphaeraceae bacterium]|jgi:Zn-dependent protease